MRTTSTISVVTKDEQVHQVVCYNDGYLSWCGRILCDHYETLEKASQLVSFRDIEKINEKCIPNHDNSHPFDNVTVFCDRNKDNVETKVFKNVEYYLCNCNFQDYNYIFINNKWYFLSYGNKLIDINDEAIEHENTYSLMQYVDSKPETLWSTL